MCLILEVISPTGDRATLDAAAGKASAAGFHVQVSHPSRWPWAKNKPVRARISEEGGCACSLLSDSADWNANTWAMRPEVLDRLATTLEILVQFGPKGLLVEALWVGDVASETVTLTPSQLGHLARSGALGTHTRYMVVTDNAG